MPSPSRIFRNFTTQQLTDLIAAAASQAIDGWFASLSGGAKSAGIQRMDPAMLLFEANAELDYRNGVRRAQKVEQRLY